MEVDDFPSSKYSKLNSNNAKQRLQPSKIGFITTGTGDGGGGPTTVTATATTTAAMGGGGGGDVLGASTRFGRQWQHSSRIIRVSRASGGKDRHSKVWTAKGPRDRRVRLSVNTAIQFYDLQDRLGYDQPSKAVEWLIKAAADSINELPSLSNINFPPDTPRSGGNINNNNNNNCVIESGGGELLQQDQQQQQQLQQVGSMSMSKSGCSSNNSETSKGSGLSLSRSEIRVKARERARERTAKEKDENLSSAARVTVAAAAAHNDNVSSMGQTSSFTQLLTAGINNLKDCTPTPSPHSNEQRAGRHMAVFCDTTTTTTPPMVDYCGTTTTGFMGLSSTHSHLGNGPLPHVMTLLPYSGSHEIQHQHQHQHQQQQQLPFFLDHHHPLIQIPNNHNNTPNNAATGGGGGGGGGGDYNLNFSISSASTTSGFNRGTLQSNSSSSPSFLSYLQRFSATDGGGGSSVPFFLGGAPISPIVDNQHYHHHHHDNHQQQYNSGGLHLNYGEGPPRHSDNKGKGKH